MCSNVTKHVAVAGSAKGASGWTPVDTAVVYYDHPYHSPLEHSVNVDFRSASDPSGKRVALELSADSARELARAILAVLEQGHGH